MKTNVEFDCLFNINEFHLNCNEQMRELMERNYLKNIQIAEIRSARNKTFIQAARNETQQN